MRSFIAGVGLGTVLLAAGCNHMPHVRDNVGTPLPDPKPENLVGYLNRNAKLVQAIQVNNLSIDAKENGRSVGLTGKMVCQKPHNFRLKANVISQPAVDIGSNNEEFWYWISKAQPPYVFHCSYANLARGNVRMPFPFQPDMVIAALGIAEYDETKKYEIKTYRDYLELIEQAVSPQGQPIQKVTVFNRQRVTAAGQPQVMAHALKDTKGNIICKAVIHRTQVNRETGAVLPQDVTLSWPEQKMEMRMLLNDVQVVNITPERAAVLFQRSDLGDKQSFDLPRMAVDGPGLQRTGVSVPRSYRP